MHDLRITRLVVADSYGRSVPLRESPALGSGTEPARATLALHASPNPVTRSSRLSYELASDGPVRVTIYDAAGRQVRSLWSGWQMAGSHVLAWDGRTDGGDVLGPGVYFARLDTERAADSKKLTVLR